MSNAPLTKQEVADAAEVMYQLGLKAKDFIEAVTVDGEILPADYVAKNMLMMLDDGYPATVRAVISNYYLTEWRISSRGTYSEEVQMITCTIKQPDGTTREQIVEKITLRKISNHGYLHVAHWTDSEGPCSVSCGPTKKHGHYEEIDL